MNTNLTINNILVSSKMVKRRAIIVEGVDDIKKYENILSSSIHVNGKVPNKVFKVYAVETIRDPNNDFYVEGCTGVIKATSDLIANTHNKLDDLKEYVLGLIDKDNRNHRQHIEAFPNFEILYMLDFYSIETFYVNRFSLFPLLNELISGSKTLITDNLIDYIYEQAINNTMDFLYFPVLEAYKKSVDPSYTNAKYGYDVEYGFIKNNQLLNDNDKATLEVEFPTMSKNFSFYVDICKGKWLLECWLEHVITIILDLKNQCGTGVLLKCDFCSANQSNKCGYKSVVPSNNIHATYIQKIFNEQPFSNDLLNFKKIINRFDLMFI